MGTDANQAQRVVCFCLNALLYGVSKSVLIGTADTEMQTRHGESFAFLRPSPRAELHLGHGGADQAQRVVCFRVTVLLGRD